MTTPPDGMALAIAAPPSDLPTTVIPHSQSNDTAITGTIVPVILGRERLLGVPEICEINYLEEICEHEDAGCLEDAENARKWRRAELEELDRQYREGEPMTGCGIALQ